MFGSSKFTLKVTPGSRMKGMVKVRQRKDKSKMKNLLCQSLLWKKWAYPCFRPCDQLCRSTLHLFYETIRNLENLSTAPYAPLVNSSFWSYRFSHTFEAHLYSSEELFTALEKAARNQGTCLMCNSGANVEEYNSSANYMADIVQML